MPEPVYPGIPAPTGGAADHQALLVVVEILERLLGQRGDRAQSLLARLQEIERRLTALETP